VNRILALFLSSATLLLATAGPTLGQFASSPVLVNDPSGESCWGTGCTQAQPSIARQGANFVVGFNDSAGRSGGIVPGPFAPLVPTQGRSGYAWSTDGGATWVDGGGLPAPADGSTFGGEPSVTSCGGRFLYASEMGTGCPTAAGGSVVAEVEPNDTIDQAKAYIVGDALQGSFTIGDPLDVFILSATAGSWLTVESGDTAYRWVRVFRADGVTEVVAGNPAWSPMRFQVPASENYYLVLSGDLGPWQIRLATCTSTPDQRAVAVSAGTLANGVLSWGAPVTVARGDGVQGPSIGCDPTSGTALLAWLDVLPGSRAIRFSKSTNGTTWTAPVAVRSAGIYTDLGVPQVAANLGGEIHVAWGAYQQLTGAHLLELSTSKTVGASFPAAVKVADFVPASADPLGYSYGLPTIPNLAVDRSAGPNAGSVYVAFHAAESPGAAVRDVFVARSTDRGASFGAPVRVNHDPEGNDQFLPSVATSTTNGQVGILFLGTQLGPLGSLDAFLSMSIDGGASFVPGVRISDSTVDWTSAVAWDDYPNMGRFTALAADGPNFYAAWTDGSLGDPDVAFAQVRRRDVPTCASLEEGAACDDGNACTTGDTCSSGACVSSGTLACTGGETECALAEVCEPRSGCVAPPKPDGGACGSACSLASSCRAGACEEPGGGDADGDGVCEVDDVCPAVADPGQSDLDQDGTGDACDSQDGSLRIRTVDVRRSTSTLRPNGLVKVEAEFLGPRSIAATGGAWLWLRDTIELEAHAAWPASLCRRLSNGVVRCRRTTRPYDAIDLRPLPSSDPDLRSWLVSARLRERALAAPFRGPISVGLTLDPGTPVLGTDRVAASEDCRSYNRGLRCSGTGGEVYGSASRAFLGRRSSTLLD